MKCSGARFYRRREHTAPRLVVPRQLRAWVLAIARARILAAVAEFEGLDPDDEVGLAGEPQELTDAIMRSLFRR